MATIVRLPAFGLISIDACSMEDSTATDGSTLFPTEVVQCVGNRFFKISCTFISNGPRHDKNALQMRADRAMLVREIM